MKFIFKHLGQKYVRTPPLPFGCGNFNFTYLCYESSYASCVHVDPVTKDSYYEIVIEYVGSAIGM